MADVIGDWYDIHGQPLDPDDGMWLSGQHGYKIVRITESHRWRVSTVWLGMDHSFGDGGKPVIFETMVFGGELDQLALRYCTIVEAVAGHRRIVDRVISAEECGEGYAGT